jgi:hypothetical protein
MLNKTWRKELARCRKRQRPEVGIIPILKLEQNENIRKVQASLSGSVYFPVLLYKGLLLTLFIYIKDLGIDKQESTCPGTYTHSRATPRHFVLSCVSPAFSGFPPHFIFQIVFGGDSFVSSCSISRLRFLA